MAEVVIDEETRHGKPVIEGTRITVEEVLGMLESGMEFGEIEEEYGLSSDEVRAAVSYANSFLKGEEVHSMA